MLNVGHGRRVSPNLAYFGNTWGRRGRKIIKIHLRPWGLGLNHILVIVELPRTDEYKMVKGAPIENDSMIKSQWRELSAFAEIRCYYASWRRILLIEIATGVENPPSQWLPFRILFTGYIWSPFLTWAQIAKNFTFTDSRNVPLCE